MIRMEHHGPPQKNIIKWISHDIDIHINININIHINININILYYIYIHTYILEDDFAIFFPTETGSVGLSTSVSRSRGVRSALEELRSARRSTHRGDAEKTWGLPWVA